MARAIDWPSEVLPTPGGPTKHKIGAFARWIPLQNAQVLQNSFFDFLQAKVIFIEHAARMRNIEIVFS